MVRLCFVKGEDFRFASITLTPSLSLLLSPFVQTTLNLIFFIWNEFVWWLMSWLLSVLLRPLDPLLTLFLCSHTHPWSPYFPSHVTTSCFMPWFYHHGQMYRYLLTQQVCVCSWTYCLRLRLRFRRAISHSLMKGTPSLFASRKHTSTLTRTRYHWHPIDTSNVDHRRARGDIDPTEKFLSCLLWSSPGLFIYIIRVLDRCSDVLEVDGWVNET